MTKIYTTHPETGRSRVHFGRAARMIGVEDETKGEN